MNETNIPKWHEKLLTAALEWRDQNPDFRFSLRTADVPGKNRLSRGYWFPGTKRYLFFPPFRVNDPHNKTKTIGFVIKFKPNGTPKYSHLDVVFGSVPNERKAVHRDIVERLGPFEQVATDKYERRYSQEDPLEAFAEFLQIDYPRLRAVIADSGQEAAFLVAEKAFESMRSRVEVHRRAAQRSGSGGFATHSEGAIEPRNLILYGPPGTGKTHRIQKLFADYTDASVNVDAEEWLRQRVADFGWRPVIAAAMAALGRPARVPEIRDHAWVVAKTQERGRIGSNVDQTLWGFLMAHTPEEVETVRYASRRPPFIFTKSEGSLWNLLKDWREQDPEGAKLHALLTAGPERDVSDVRRYRAVTFHPSYSYEDFVRGIRPVVDEETGQTSFRSVDGIFKQICDEARKNPGKQYALFIDEINRANIAKVFGELITLLEPDKRARYSADGKLVGGMVVQLPGGSGTEVVEEPFGVPANLDVYGTMNTADRSIALLDIALRRRFEFEEMLPEYGLLSAAVEGVDVGRMLRRINDRLEYLLDRDHRIGHAYIMRAKSVEDLRRAFRLQIIPLLQEYFFDDFARVALVLATPRGVPPFLVPERVVQGALFAAGLEGGVPAERTRYSVAEPSSWTEASFAGLYTESRAADPQ